MPKHLQSRVTACAAAIAAAALLWPCAGDAAQSSVASARHLKAIAVKHLEKSQLASGDAKAAELKKAASLLRATAKLLEKHPDPKPPGVEREIQDINSLLYWANKMTPVTGGAAAAVSGIKLAPGKTRDDTAREYFQRVQDYAKHNPTAHFLLAIRYFEVADRFQGTSWSLKAQGLSLEYQRRTMASAPTPGVAPAANEKPKKPVVDRAPHLARLDKAMNAGPTGMDVSAAAEIFLAVLPGDALAIEVKALGAIASSEGDRERAAAVLNYLSAHPRGRYATKVAPLKPNALEWSAFDELVGAVKASPSSLSKARLCAGFLDKRPAARMRDEVAAVAEALKAGAGAEKVSAWSRYRASFPKGSFMGEATRELGRSEGSLVASINTALAGGQTLKASGLARLYLDVFPKRPAAPEVRSLAGILDLPTRSERIAAVKKHARRFGQGHLRQALGRAVDAWRSAAAEDAFGRLVEELADARSDRLRLEGIDRFLKAAPRGAHAAQAKDLRAALMLRSARARSTAARRFLRKHPDGRLTAEVTALERKATEAVEKETYREAMVSYEDASRTHAAKLAACESYLGEFPDGTHAREIRDCEERLRASVRDEARAYEKLTQELKNVSPDQGASICSEFLRKHAGGANHTAVEQLKRGFENRLAEAAEAKAFAELTTHTSRSSVPAISRSEACLRFLRNHGKGKHRAEAPKLARSLASSPLPDESVPLVAAAFAGKSGDLVTTHCDEVCSTLRLRTWRVPQLTLRSAYDIEPGISVSSVGTSADGGRLFLGEGTGGMLVMDISRGRIIGRYRLGRGPVVSISYADDGTVLSATRGDARARAWHVSDWRMRSDYTLGGRVAAVASDSRGTRIAVAGDSGKLMLSRAGELSPLWSDDNAHDGAVDSVVFSPNGSRLASASSGDGSIRFWSASSGKELWHADDTPPVAFCGDDLVVTASSLRLAKDGRIVANLEGRAPVAASPDGRFIFTGREPGGVVWYVPALLAE